MQMKTQKKRNQINFWLEMT